MTDANRTLFERAQRVIPGGVNSPVRAFGSVGGTPYFVDRSDGPYVWDADGRRYIDYVQSYGSGILGHAHPVVLEAISVAASRGTSFGAPTEAEVVMAEMVVERISGLESVRFVSSGTEATMSAIRLARGATGRPGIVKFAGCYHGHGDALLAAGGSGVANQGLTGCDGVTAGAVADTIVAPYNVVPELDETVAAVIVEPVAANMGLVAPASGLLYYARTGEGTWKREGAGEPQRLQSILSDPSEPLRIVESRSHPSPALEAFLKQLTVAERVRSGSSLKFCLVADGRDMGTVVFADAQLKIYLTASAEERASRRYRQLLGKGETANLASLLDEIVARDERDMNRSVAPLKPADDAILIDSTQMSIEEVLETVQTMARERNLLG